MLCSGKDYGTGKGKELDKSKDPKKEGVVYHLNVGEHCFLSECDYGKESFFYNGMPNPDTFALTFVERGYVHGCDCVGKSMRAALAIPTISYQNFYPRTTIEIKIYRFNKVHKLVINAVSPTGLIARVITSDK